MKKILGKVFNGHHLSREEAHRAMVLLISGETPPEQAAALLGALRAKKECLDEIVGFTRAMRERMVPLPVRRQDLMDTCGTGGSGTDAFNISTTVAFIAAAAGIGVAKHGNRAVSSRCGSADVLEELGLRIDFTPESSARALDELGIAFLFAPAYHPALKAIGPVRRAIGVRTILNILGPLVNPAHVRRQVIGVPDASLTAPLAEALRELGSEEVMVVHGAGGLDEFSLCGPTQVSHLSSGQVRGYHVNPEDFDLMPASLSEIQGGDARENAAILEGILRGEIQGAKRDIVLLNAAAALQVAGKADSFPEGIAQARGLLDNGAALGVLNRLRGFQP